MSTAQVGPIELYYEEHGSGDPLLLIMGFAADSMAWMFQTPEFGRHFRTIAFDNRGVGRSSKPAGPYSIAEMADDTAGLLDVLGVARAHVLGVSMGGMIAQELALRHPGRVRGLVLSCTYPEPDEETRAQGVALTQELGGSVGADGQLQMNPNGLDPMMFFQSILPRVFNPAFIQNELPRLMELFGSALQWGFDVQAIMAQAGATMLHRTTDRLHQIKAPTLVITGDCDRLISPRNSDVLAQHIPGAKLVKIEGGSHAFNFETPDVFNRAVLDFLASVSA
nr:alpha/beta hydrolase AS-Trib19 [uncultured bacterium]